MKEILNLSFKNLIIFMKRYTVLFIITMISLVLSTLTMMYVVVKLDCLSDNLSRGDLSMNCIKLNNSEAMLPIQDISDRLISYKKGSEQVDSVLGMIRSENISAACIIDDEANHLKKYAEQNLLLSGRAFNDDELVNGSNVMITVGSRAEVDYQIDLNGCQYTVVGSMSGNKLTNAYVPIRSCISNNIVPFEYKIVYTEDMSVDTIKENIAELKKLFPEMKVETVMDYYREKGILSFDFENTFLIIMAIVSLTSCAFLYSYIIDKRVKDIYIYKICGAAKSKLLCIALAELVCILIMQLIPALLLFLFVLIPVQKKYDVVFYYGYSYYHILTAVAIVIVCALIIYLPVLINTFRKSAVELKQSRK